MVCILNSERVVVIPAYNEAETLFRIVHAMRTVSGTVLVVNDGSSDSTEAEAVAAGAACISIECNSGYEHALGVGLAHALDMGGKLIVTADADGQHQEVDVRRVFEALESGCGVVVTKRSFFNRFGEHLVSLWGKWRLGFRDPLSGLKGYDRSTLKKLGTEVLIGGAAMCLAAKARKEGIEISELDIQVLPRVGQSRFGVSVIGEWRVISAIFVIERMLRSRYW